MKGSQLKQNDKSTEAAGYKDTDELVSSVQAGKIHFIDEIVLRILLIVNTYM